MINPYSVRIFGSAPEMAIAISRDGTEFKLYYDDEETRPDVRSVSFTKAGALELARAIFSMVMNMDTTKAETVAERECPAHWVNISMNNYPPEEK